MPFAGYDDFDDCVRKNSDKDDPKAYCATIQKMAEGGRRPDTTQQTSAQRGAADADRWKRAQEEQRQTVSRNPHLYTGQERRRAHDRRRGGYGVPGFLNRRRGERRGSL